MIKSPLRYPGGKSKAVKAILPLFPANVDKVISPFLGGGSVELALVEKGVRVVGSDSFRPLMEFWWCLQYHPKTLADRVAELYPLSKEQFYELQRNYKQRIEDKRELCLGMATMFYVLNRSSFDGTTLSGGCSKPSARFTQSSIDRIRNWTQLKDFDVRWGANDFRDILQFYRDDYFIFADPPYFLKQNNLYGVNGSHHKTFDHKALYDILSKRDGWILCYNDCPTIREMYGKYRIVEPHWNYGMGNNKKSRELLILNY